MANGADATTTPNKPPEPTTSWSDTQKLLAFIVVAAFISVIFFWMFRPPALDPASTAVLNTLVGTLGSFAGMVITFYFGSSRGERTKDGTIATQLTGTSGNGSPPATPPTPPQPSG